MVARAHVAVAKQSRFRIRHLPSRAQFFSKLGCIHPYAMNLGSEEATFSVSNFLMVNFHAEIGLNRQKHENF
jgi:hypothetical protein